MKITTMGRATTTELCLDRNTESSQLNPSAELRSIIEGCAGIPDSIKRTTITCVTERTFDQAIFEQLICQAAPDSKDSDWGLRLQRRRNALSQYVGCTLTCVYGRLPGVHYTIEIDRERSIVVHWEWQPI